MDVEQICMDLFHADHEDEVLGILSHHDLEADDHWVPLGGIENNLSIAGNQQSSATAAVVEKLVNSIDSLLLLQCQLRHIQPESAVAPASMVAAAAELFNVPDGSIASLKPPERAKLAEHIQLVATGGRIEPCYTIIDEGEGQRPCDFASTLCSLVQTNKLRIRFVQGKYNMGGSGVLPFCGRHNLQLIMSRRHPLLVRHGTEHAEVGWGWTVIRRREPGGGRRSSHYQYFAPGNNIPCFDGKTLPLRPTRDQAFGGPLEWGCVIKLYNYQSEFPSAVTLDLNYELSRRLYQIPLPIRLFERRSGYSGHSLSTILTGLSVRITDDRSKAIEQGFPDSGVIHVDGVGDVPIEIVVFKRGEGRSFLTPATAILFTVNGQVHGGLGRRFCSREGVALDFLKNDLMVILNCTEVSARTREDLFMPSRDRLRECQAKKTFEAALEAFLGDHEVLSRLNKERREAELRDRLTDDKPLSDALKSIIDSSPELRALFRLGVMLPLPTVPGPRDEEFQGVPYPTFFRLARKDQAGCPTFDCTPKRGARIHFETDAANEYFTRLNDPGAIAVSPATLFDRISLHNGRANLVLKWPRKGSIGDELDVMVQVSDSHLKAPFAHQFRLKLAEESPAREPSDEKSTPPKTGGLALPKIVEIEAEGWANEEFGPESGLSIQRDVDGGLVAKVNVANTHLKQFVLRSPQAEVDLIRKRFVYGLVLAGVSLWEQFRDAENSDDLIRDTSSAIARVLLPMISVLSGLDATDHDRH